MDTPWWVAYSAEVNAVGFKGLRVRGPGSSQSRLATRATFAVGCLNSGAGALLMAAAYGARVIHMLGYDCKPGPAGERHWHPNHGNGLGNAGMLHKWPAQFQSAAIQLQGVRVTNCTRSTALTMFPVAELDDIVNNG